VDELEQVLKEAVEAVKSGRSAVVDAQLDGSVGAYTEEKETVSRKKEDDKGGFTGDEKTLVG
jgi:hypothetical protein